jgi:hypothetical protein
MRRVDENDADDLPCVVVVEHSHQLTSEGVADHDVRRALVRGCEQPVKFARDAVSIARALAGSLHKMPARSYAQARVVAAMSFCTERHPHEPPMSSPATSPRSVRRIQRRIAAG